MLRRPAGPSGQRGIGQQRIDGVVQRQVAVAVQGGQRPLPRVIFPTISGGRLISTSACMYNAWSSAVPFAVVSDVQPGARTPRWTATCSGN